MEKVFAPILANSSVIEFLMASIAVRIPTRAMMPNPMISMVRIARSILARMDRILMRRFSEYRCKSFIKS
jgi:hypothetical protein